MYQHNNPRLTYFIFSIKVLNNYSPEHRAIYADIHRGNNDCI